MTVLLVLQLSYQDARRSRTRSTKIDSPAAVSRPTKWRRALKQLRPHSPFKKKGSPEDHRESPDSSCSGAGTEIMDSSFARCDSSDSLTDIQPYLDTPEDISTHPDTTWRSDPGGAVLEVVTPENGLDGLKLLQESVWFAIWSMSARSCTPSIRTQASFGDLLHRMYAVDRFAASIALPAELQV